MIGDLGERILRAMHAVSLAAHITTSMFLIASGHEDLRVYSRTLRAILQRAIDGTDPKQVIQDCMGHTTPFFTRHATREMDTLKGSSAWGPEEWATYNNRPLLSGETPALVAEMRAYWRMSYVTPQELLQWATAHEIPERRELQLASVLSDVDTSETEEEAFNRLIQEIDADDPEEIEELIDDSEDWTENDMDAMLVDAVARSELASEKRMFCDNVDFEPVIHYMGGERAARMKLATMTVEKLTQVIAERNNPSSADVAAEK